MKVVHVVTVAGSLGFLRGQGKFFADHGIEIVAVSSPGVGSSEFGEQEGIRTLGVPMARKISPLADLMSIWRLVRVFRAERPDIVHAQTPKGGLLGTIAARFAGVPVTIYHIHGLPYMGLTGIKRWLLMGTEWVSSTLANTVFCVSASIAEVAIADNLLNREKVKVFLKGSSNGVDTLGRFNPANVTEAERTALRKKYGIPADAVVCLFVGRITSDKGVRELAAAWSQVTDIYPGAWLILVGMLDDRLPLDKRTLDALGQMPTVVLAGKQSNVQAYYAASDIVVLPTYREGLGMVLIEAAAMAKPTIATNIPGCTDAVEDGVTGDLVPAKDANALSRAIVALIDDPARREAYGLAGRERVVKYFDSRRIWEAILAEYNRLVSVHT